VGISISWPKRASAQPVVSGHRRTPPSSALAPLATDLPPRRSPGSRSTDLETRSGPRYRFRSRETGREVRTPLAENASKRHGDEHDGARFLNWKAPANIILCGTGAIVGGRFKIGIFVLGSGHPSSPAWIILAWVSLLGALALSGWHAVTRSGSTGPAFPAILH